MALYHPFGYGSTVAIPGTDIAVSIQVRGDNQARFPERDKGFLCMASCDLPWRPSRFYEFEHYCDGSGATAFRVAGVTKEMGDTWIYGVGSDPAKWRGIGSCAGCGGNGCRTGASSLATP